MDDPVILVNGQSYERAAITEWLSSHSNDPITNQDLKNKRIISNFALKSAIQAHQVVLRRIRTSMLTLNNGIYSGGTTRNGHNMVLYSPSFLA